MPKMPIYFIVKNVTLNALRNPTTHRTYPHANTQKTIKCAKWSEKMPKMPSYFFVKNVTLNALRNPTTHLTYQPENINSQEKCRKMPKNAVW